MAAPAAVANPDGTTAMMRAWFLGCASALALAAAPALAAPTAAPVNTSAPAPSAAPATVTRATLANGLRVVIVQDKLAPVVTTEINYLAGSNDAPAGFPGTAHALEHMMFRGSQGLDKDQLSEIASLIGGNYNADTTETVTQFFYTVPADDLDVALRIESLRMNSALLNESDWDKERGAIEQEVSRDLSSPVYTYLSQLQSIMFAGTPYQHDALGTRPSFNKTTAPLLRKFYETWYHPNNAILVIAGDVDPAQALALVKQRFGDIPSKKVPEHAPIEPTPVTAKTLTLPTDLPIGVATLAWRMPGLQSKDFAAADILSDVIASQRGALYDLVVKGDALVTEFAYEPKAQVGYGVVVGGFPKGGDPQPLLTKLRAVMEDIAKNGVPPDLVAAAKRREVAQLAFRNNDITGVAESWSNALAFQKLSSPDDLARAYTEVTVDDVNRIARETLDPAHAITAILTPQASGNPIGGHGFGGAESFGGAPGKPVPLPDWANTALNTLSIPPAGTPPVVTTLPNGLRLIVQTSHVTPTVSVFGDIREEPAMQEPKGQDGVADMVEQMLGFGTETRDRLAFQKALDDIAADEQAGSSFGLQILSNEFKPGMELLADNELHPAFPADAYAVVQKQQEQNLAGLLQSPDYLFGRAAEIAVLPAGDPLRRQATPQTTAAISLAQMRAYWAKAYRPDLTTIVVIGDVTPEQAKDVVSATFGDWKADGAKPNTDLPAIPPSTASFAHVPDSSSVQDTVALTQSLPIPVTNPERYRLMLGNTILGGGFSSRLYNDLRVHGGLVYSVDSSFDWTRTRCTYSVSFGADPDKVKQAATMAVHDIEQMATAPVSDAELTRAKAQTLRSLPMQRASVSALAHLYLRLVDLGLPLDQPQIAAKYTYDATAPEIKDAYAKWMNPSALSRVVKGPAVTQ
jgi:zinc protease